jgi:hypothetical protein
LKFKSIFILSEIILLVFFVIIVLLPYFMLGSVFAVSFWRNNWPLFLVLVLFLFALNFFYFSNRRLFSLLEKEDWPALIRFLEERVIQKGRYSSRLVRLLANSYLVLADSASVISFENKVAIAKPALLDANALVFGTARILGQDFPGALRFFETRKDKVKAAHKEWMRWYYGFALLLNRQYEQAGNEFSLLARFSKDGVITALSSYFLSEPLTRSLPDKRPEFQNVSSEGRMRIRQSLPRQSDWNREISRLSSEIHVAAISKYVEETSNWLY